MRPAPRRGRADEVRDTVLRGDALPQSPWIYRKRVIFPDSTVRNGAYVALRDRGGRLLARGFLNRRSEIAFRVLGGPGAPQELRPLLAQRLREAWALRARALDLPRVTDAFRLVHGEGDGLSGLVVDRYGSTCVASLYALGWVAAAEELEAELLALPDVERVMFRADQRSQQLEGFRLPPLPEGQETVVREGALRFHVDFAAGHKTGLFLDQRENRALVAGFARGRRMLDLCTNAGGFALACSAAGARHVTAVDLDEQVLSVARRNAHLAGARVEWVHADLFSWLRERAGVGDRFDLVVLDPPRLAAGRKDAEPALVTYRDMNRLAFSVCSEGAFLFTCSCSGAVDEHAFLGAVRRAARQAGREARILALRGAASDHPISLDFLEGRYLKGILLQVR